MRQDGNRMSEEADFEDKRCDRCIAEITRLQKLIVIEEEKLFKAMQEARKLKGLPQSDKGLKQDLVEVKTVALSALRNSLWLITIYLLALILYIRSYFFITFD